MKILFVIVPDNDKGRYIFKKRNYDNFIILGVAQASSVLKQEGHIIRAIDLRLAKEPQSELFKSINSFKPDAIHLSAYFVSLGNLKKYAFMIKKKYSIPIYFGGIYPSLYPITIMEDSIQLPYFDGIDFMIAGEETAFKDLLKKRKTAKVLENIEELPFPDFSIFDIQKYYPLPKHYKRMPVIPLLTSRGCSWGKCKFCSQSHIIGYYRKMSPGKVVAMVKQAVDQYGAKEIRFWDDTFFHDRKWIMAFCSMMKKENTGVIWSCHERVSMVSEDILFEMKKAGCWQILFGIESGNESVLSGIDKGINKKQAVKAVAAARKAGIESRVSFILGFPDETPDMTDETINFAKKLHADITQFSIFTPYPGTELYSRIEKDIPRNFESYSEIEVICLPKGYSSKKQLMEKYRNAYLSIYLNPRYIIKSILQIRSFEDLNRQISGLKTMLGLALGKK